MSDIMTPIVSCFRALADPSRLRLLALLRERPVCVEKLVSAMAASQPKVSRHLAYLRRAGLVDGERRGRHVYYRVRPQHDDFVQRILSELLRHLGSLPLVRADQRRLVEQAGRCP